MVGAQPQLHKHLLDQAPMWILITARHSGALRFANERANMDLGLSQDDDLQFNERDLWAVSGQRSQFIAQAQSEGHARGEAELIKPNGERVWVMVDCQSISESPDVLLWWMCDLSAQKEAQRDLEQHQVMLEQVLDSLPIAIFAKDVKNDFRYVLDNAKSAEMFGTSEAGVLGKTDAELSTPEIAELLLQQDLEVIRTGKPYINPQQVLKMPDGDHFYFSMKKVLINGPDGQPNLILGVSEDVSDRAEVEKSLRNSEKRTRQLLEHSPVGMFFTDANGGCLYVNDKWEELSGITIKQAAGQGWAEAVHPDDVKRVTESWQEFVENKSVFSLVFRYILAGGRVTWVACNAVPFRNDDDEVVGFLGTSTDITRHKQLEAELKSSTAEAQRANAAKSEFLSRMSHELRTPLNAVLGFSQLMQMRNENLTSEQVEGVAHIHAAGQQLLSLIENLMNRSRAEDGRPNKKV